MPNLLDAIRQNSQIQPQGQTDETQKLQGLLRAKSGKDVGGGSVAASSLGEQSAVSQANQQLQSQVVPQAQIQQQGLEQQQAQQNQQAEIQGQQIGQQRRANTLQNKVQTEQILNDLERSKGQIDLQSQKAKVDQVAQNLRLSTQQYVDNLQREGSRKRLDNSASFQEELNKSILGDQQDLLQKQLGNRDVLQASDRDFKKAMNNMQLSDARNLFQKNMKQQKQRALYSTIGAATSAGIGAYGTYANQQAGSTAAPASGNQINGVDSGSSSLGMASRTV